MPCNTVKQVNKWPIALTSIWFLSVELAFVACNIYNMNENIFGNRVCSWFSLNIQIFTIRNWMDNTRVDMASFIASMSILNWRIFGTMVSLCSLFTFWEFIEIECIELESGSTCRHGEKTLLYCIVENVNKTCLLHWHTC